MGGVTIGQVNPFRQRDAPAATIYRTESRANVTYQGMAFVSLMDDSVPGEAILLQQHQEKMLREWLTDHLQEMLVLPRGDTLQMPLGKETFGTFQQVFTDTYPPFWEFIYWPNKDAVGGRIAGTLTDICTALNVQHGPKSIPAATSVGNLPDILQPRSRNVL